AVEEVHGSPEDEARMLERLADLHYQLGHSERAAELHRRAGEVLESLGVVAAADVARSSAALALARAGRHVEAVALFREVLEGARRRQEAANVAGTLLDLGVSLSALGRLEE